MIQKLFSTKGRINRKTYTLFSISYMILGFIIGLMGQHYLTTPLSFPTILLLILIASLFTYVGHCLTIKRLHDLDRPASDIWQLNLSWTLQYQLFLEKGTYGKNQYGYPQDPPTHQTVRS